MNFLDAPPSSSTDKCPANATQCLLDDEKSPFAHVNIHYITRQSQSLAGEAVSVYPK